MTEDEAKEWLARTFGISKVEALERFVALLSAELPRQNLIATSTRQMIWSRHVVDSAQLLKLAPDGWRHWVDIGTGAGFPGMVVALLSDKRVTMIEPRKLRATFLHRVAGEMELSDAIVLPTSVQNTSVNIEADVVSARAVASLSKLLELASPIAARGATYLFSKGAKAAEEVAVARTGWSGAFHVEPSIVDPTSSIVVVTKASRR